MYLKIIYSDAFVAFYHPRYGRYLICLCLCYQGLYEQNLHYFIMEIYTQLICAPNYART